MAPLEYQSLYGNNCYYRQEYQSLYGNSCYYRHMENHHIENLSDFPNLYTGNYVL